MKNLESNKGYHFPLINPKKGANDRFPIKHYLNHIKEEIKEFEDAPSNELKREEVVDILHAAETLVRHYFDRVEGKSFKNVKKETIEKNAKRGYYQR